MVQRARIVTVSRHPTVQWMFDEIEPLLATAGHEVVPYRTEAAFRADPSALTEADVLLAGGRQPALFACTDGRRTSASRDHLSLHRH